VTCVPSVTPREKIFSSDEKKFLSDEKKILSDEKKILSDETKILSDEIYILSGVFCYHATIFATTAGASLNKGIPKDLW